MFIYYYNIIYNTIDNSFMSYIKTYGVSLLKYKENSLISSTTENYDLSYTSYTRCKDNPLFTSIQA